jgi:hypothetical protein
MRMELYSKEMLTYVYAMITCVVAESEGLRDLATQIALGTLPYMNECLRVILRLNEIFLFGEVIVMIPQS